MNNPKLSNKNWQFLSFFSSITPKILLGIMSIFLTALPTKAAEKIYITYQSLQLSVKVDSLTEYAKTGVINSDLGFYLKFVDKEDQEKFREILTKKVEIDPVLLSRLLNTEIGEDILKRLGKIFNIPWNIDGKYAIRGALIKAALSSDGLTFLTFLQQFPTNLQLSVDRVLLVAESLKKTVKATEAMIVKMSELTDKEAKLESPVNFAQLPDLSKPGPQGFVREVTTLNDTNRQRKFRVILYHPQTWKEGKTPVIVISHGLASKPEDYEDMAKHLASYGYFVALPQHIGSDSEHAKALIEGTTRTVANWNEFIDRPLDVTYVLNYLEQQNQVRYGGRLNLTEVGVAGHSFGGYTALAIAGAEIDFDYLTEECDITHPLPNTSLLLECRALKLERKPYNFRDERVTSVMVVNPVNNSIFGPKGLAKIKIPLIMVAGSYDPATPAVYEQFNSFPLIKSNDKYLALAEGQAHVNFSKLDPGISQEIHSLDFVQLPPPQLLQKYGFSTLLVFAQVYVAKDESYRPYINSFSRYSQYLSQGEEFKIFIVSGQASPEIETTLTELGIFNKPNN